ncbi:hypothetical protein NDU88_008709 [Pleurodeles waltl]|uniref:Uncharacterized protein n=1 Tax=Pleurodeles waltl TaxID=8319 RepID=A0AAV7PPY4_PLEWA|nr:hypothetical protein NDU88_008709 [Pleurodeles waltl]
MLPMDSPGGGGQPLEVAGALVFRFSPFSSVGYFDGRGRHFVFSRPSGEFACCRICGGGISLETVSLDASRPPELIPAGSCRSGELCTVLVETGPRSQPRRSTLSLQPHRLPATPPLNYVFQRKLRTISLGDEPYSYIQDYISCNTIRDVPDLFDILDQSENAIPLKS